MPGKHTQFQESASLKLEITQRYYSANRQDSRTAHPFKNFSAAAALVADSIPIAVCYAPEHMARPAQKRTGGAPEKAKGGLDRALYVRANEELLRKLERLQQIRSKAAKITLSQADVVRALVNEAIEREREKK